jgi:CBS domain-containing protein
MLLRDAVLRPAPARRDLPVITVEATLHDALDVMLENGREKILVVEDESGAGRVLGAIRMDDLMAAICDESNDEQLAKAEMSAVSS